jgi:hypothetical protein
MKKIISIFSAAAMLFGMFPSVSFAYASDYYAYLTKTSYTGSDPYFTGSFSFPEGVASLVVVDLYNSCGEMTTAYDDPLGFTIDYGDQSPQPFYIPINSSEDCYYNSNYSCLGGDGAYPYDGNYYMVFSVYEWSESELMYEQYPIYSTELDFYYNGGSTEMLSCDGGAVCGDGICSAGESCTADDCCNGAEKWLDTDEWNCGSCGTVCDSNETCENGVCTSFNDCGNGVCDSGETCAADHCCSGSYKDFANDVYNCGSCGNACALSETCENGVCLEGSYCGDGVCSSGESCSADNCCSGLYTNTSTDPSNCGFCGTVCSSNQECKYGLCKDKKMDYYDARDQAACTSDDCERAQQCIVELDPYTGCLMEFADVIPLLDKPVAVVLLADDICSLKDRIVEQADPIGVAVKAVLMVVDVADNIPDTVGFAGYVISVPVDIVEGIIDCLEGFIYSYLEDCGGYTWCLINLGKAVMEEAYNLGKSVGNMAFSMVHSPVSVGVVNDYGQELGVKDGVFVWEFGDIKAVMVRNPEQITGGYNIALEGTGSGTYELDTVVMDTSGEVVKELKAENVPVSTGQNDYYKVEVPYDLNSDDISMEETEITPLADFSDLSTDNWAYDYVAALVADGAIGGYPDGTFRPDKNITRAELLKIAMEYFDVEQQTYGYNFTDVGEFDWYAGYVAGGTYYNFISGYSDITFKPNKSITRAEALKVILGASNVYVTLFDLTVDLEAIAADYGTAVVDASAIFPDVASDAWYKNDVSGAVTYGLVGGYPDGTFKPDKEITRAEASKIIYFVKDFLNRYSE